MSDETFYIDCEFDGHNGPLLITLKKKPITVWEAADRIEALKAKLNEAIKLAELIRKYSGMGMNPSTDLQHMASDLLAILKGESHE